MNRGAFYSRLASRNWPIAGQSRTCGEITEPRMRSSHLVDFRPLGVLDFDIFVAADENIEI